MAFFLKKLHTVFSDGFRGWFLFTGVGMAAEDAIAAVEALVAAVSSASESNPISQWEGGGNSGEEDLDQDEADALLATAEVVKAEDERAEEVVSVAGSGAEEEAEEKGESSSKAAEAALEPTSSKKAADDEATEEFEHSSDEHSDTVWRVTV